MRRAKLMIISDDRQSIKEVKKLVVHSAFTVYESTDADWAMIQLQENPCDIILLCHQQISTSENFYMNFLMFTETAPVHPHQVILLCNGKNAKEAYNLCNKSIFDDYVIYKPLYDANLVKWAIHLAQQRLQDSSYQQVLMKRIDQLLIDLDKLKGAIEDRIKDHYRLQADLDKSELFKSEMKKYFSSGINKLKTYIGNLQQDIEVSAEQENSIKDKIEAFKDDVNSGDIVIGLPSIETKSSSDKLIKATNHEIENHKIRQTALADSDLTQDKIKVLVVEDEEVNQKMVKMILEKEGFEVFCADDGPSAITTAHRCMPDLILMDIKLPKMNGYKVTVRLKSDPRYKKTHIIMLTAHSENEIVKKCISSGASDYIVKPAKKSKLLERIYLLYPHLDDNLQ